MINPEFTNISENKDLNFLAEQLDELQNQENNGRGISCIRQVVADLRVGDLENARQVCFWDHDKIINYPQIKSFIIANLFEPGEDHPWSVLEKLQLEDREK